MKIPCAALSSTSVSNKSPPSYSTVPPSTMYPSFPARTLESVDFPDPFGPIIAWTSPGLIESDKPLTIVGSGNQKRDFTYVSDVVNAFYKCINYNGKINIFNIGTGRPISINKIVEILKSEKIHIPKRPGEPNQTNANNKKAIKELKWRPVISIEKGISLVLKNISYWKSAPVWTPKKIQIATADWFKYLK